MSDQELPGKGGEVFKIKLTKNLGCSDLFDVKPINIPIVSVSKPKRIWYKVLLEKITFGIYSAPYEMMVKIKNNE